MHHAADASRQRCSGLIVVWVLIVGLLFVHALFFRNYVGRIDQLAFAGAGGLRENPSRRGGAETPLQHVVPTSFSDAQMWVRHALALADGAGPQLRWTDTDNAPYGREVHWNSALAWAIVGAGGLRHLFTGEPLPSAIEHSLWWFNLPLLIGAVVCFSWCVQRRLGQLAGICVAVLMIGQPDFYVGFSPYYVDHHGLLAAAVLGLVLGVVFMGVGFWCGEVSTPVEEQSSLLPASPALARRGAILSAVSGAFGMWISAATLIPAIAAVGVVAGAATLAFGRRALSGGVGFAPDLWRLWGRLGAGLSVLFYLLEYAPAHFGWRLEVNHPVYALAWWGGSEVLAQFGSWRCTVAGLPAIRPLRLLAAFAALAFPAVIIAVAGERVFVVFDPFVARLSGFVSEGLSFGQTVEVFGWRSVAAKLPAAVATLIIAIVLLARARANERVASVFIVGVTAVFAILGLAQTRWWSTFSAADIVLLTLGLIVAIRGCAARRHWIYAGALLAGVCAPVIVGRTYEQWVVNRRGITDPSNRLQVLYRDIAANVRAEQPHGDIMLLASPNASGGISYYGGFKSIGTLYWENLAGTKAAAAMFSAQTDVDARRLLRRRGVTHIAMISDTNFLAEYFSLQYPTPNPKTETLEDSFGYQLLVRQEVPLWLEQIPYEAPRQAREPGVRVLLFATKYSTPAADQLFEDAVAQIEAGRLVSAQQTLERALAIAPRCPEFWVIHAHLRLAGTDVRGAVDDIYRALGCAEPGQLYALCTSEARRLYQSGAPGPAVDLYRRAFALQPDPDVANNLIWILATTTDDHVRNGGEALQLAERHARERSDYTSLAGYAAALAECHDLERATAVANQALAAARKEGDAALIKKAEACRAAYEAGHAWRE